VTRERPPGFVPDVVDAVFVAEARDLGGMPAPGPPEIAISGRSNVGKSTLLNRLAGRKGLARTSKTPGRTRGLVMFSLRLGRAAPLAELRLIDLPGYGYAQVSRAERQTWQPLIEGYTRVRPSLALFVILIDSRRGVEDEERQLYEWLGTEHVPAQIVLTKVDKLSATERGLLRERCGKTFGGRAPIMISGETGEGVPALWAAIFEAAAAATRAAPPAADPASPLLAPPEVEEP
jgi:GTP-binding protein